MVDLPAHPSPPRPAGMAPPARATPPAATPVQEARSMTARSADYVPPDEAASGEIMCPNIYTTWVWDEVRAERIRAHRKHGKTSMESQPPDAWRRYMILAEEVG